MKTLLLKQLSLRCLLALSAYVRDWLESLEIEIGSRNLNNGYRGHHD